MSVVNFLQVIEGDAFFSFPVPLLDALVADEWVALEVDDGFEGAVHHESIAETAVYAVF